LPGEDNEVVSSEARRANSQREPPKRSKESHEGDAISLNQMEADCKRPREVLGKVMDQFDVAAAFRLRKNASDLSF
jgi:hypothetical protein